MSIETRSGITQQEIRQVPFQLAFGGDFNNIPKETRFLKGDPSPVSDKIKNPQRTRIHFSPIIIEEHTQIVYGESALKTIPDLYNKKKLSDSQIAEILGIEGGRFAISAWRADKEIATRSRDEAVRRFWEGRETQAKKEGGKLVWEARRNPVIFSKLTTRQREVLGFRYPVKRDSKSLTYDAIGKEIGIVPEAVRRREKRALRKIKRLLKSADHKPTAHRDDSESGKKPSEGNTKRFYSQSSEVRVDKTEGAKEKKVGFKRKRIRVNEEDAKTVLEARQNPDIFFKLTPKQREVLRYRYPVGKRSKSLSLEKTAKKIGVRKRQVVWEREQGALKKIIKLLKRKNLKSPVDK